MFAKYSRNHCLTSIPYDAAIRLIIRLANHATLVTMSIWEGVKSGIVKFLMVLLRNGGVVV